MTQTAPTFENTIARNARLARAAAERAREYRARKKAERAPDPRTADAAIVEAMAFVLAKYVPLAAAVNAGTPLSLASVPVLEILATATDILVQDGYNREKSRTLIADRVASRPDHKEPHNVPSLNPHTDPARIMPPRLWPGDPIPTAPPLHRRGMPAATLAAYLRLDDENDA